MPQTITVPNFGEVEFPDETPVSEVEAAIRRDIFKLAPLPPAFTEPDNEKFLERRFVAKSNVSNTLQDLQRKSVEFDDLATRFQSGEIDADADTIQRASDDLRLAQEAYKIAEREFGEVQKDPSTFFESTKAQLAQSGLYTAASVAEMLDPYDQHVARLEDLRGRPKREADQGAYDALRKRYQELEGQHALSFRRPEDARQSLALFEREVKNGTFQRDMINNAGTDPKQIDALIEDRRKRLTEEISFAEHPEQIDAAKWRVVQELKELENPIAETAQGQIREGAENTFENFAASEFSENARGQAGRAVGQFLPAAAAGSLGLPAAVLQLSAEGYQRAYQNKRTELMGQGKSAAEADIEAQVFASDETLKSTPELAAYMVAGRLSAGFLARYLPKNSPLLRSIVGGLGAAGTNVGVSGLLGHYKDGSRVQQLTTDLLWGAIHGRAEYRTARQALNVLNGTAPEMQRLMTLATDNAREQLAAQLEARGDTFGAKRLRFQMGEDQRMALAKIDEMRAGAARALGKGRQFQKEEGERKYPFPPREEVADEITNEAIKNSAPDVGPATEAAARELGKPIAPARAVIARPNFEREEAIKYSEADTAGGVPSISERESGAVEPGEAPTETRVSDLQVVEAPIDRLKLSTDVPQFKAGSDPTTGVVEPLSGTFDRRGVGPIQLWERNNGDLEIISGRHRYDLAKRSGEKTIPAQIHREADGFDVQQAAMLDAELNIRDGQGSVADYANYFRNAETSEADAQARGLLGRAKGRQGFSIGKRASEDLFALHQSGKLSDAKAAAIVDAAPGDANLQRLALKFVEQSPNASAGDIGHYLNATAAFQKLGEFTVDAQGDLFGQSDAALNAANKAAEVAKELEAKAREDVKILQTAANRSGQLRLTDAEAARFGVPKDNPEAIRAALAEAKEAASGWEAWHLDDAKKAAVFALAGVKPKPAAEKAPGEPVAKPGAPKEDLFAGRPDDVFNLTAESAKDKAAKEAREQADAAKAAEEQAARDRAEAEKAQTDLFAEKKSPETPEKPPEMPKKAAETPPPASTTPKPAAEPVAVPKRAEPPPSKRRVRLGASPQTYTVEAELPAQKGDLPGERYFRVKNERTGEEQTVESRDLRDVGKKGKRATELEALADGEAAKVPDRPEVQLFEALGDVPAELGGEAPNVKKAISDGNIVEGWHVPLPDGRRVLVLNRAGIEKIAEQMGISVEERTAQVTRHEIGHDRQHIGALLPAPDRRAYDSVVEGVLSRDKAMASEISDLYGYDVRTREGRAKTAEEMLVREGEKPKPAAWYHRAMAALLEIFRSIGYKGKLTESELRTMLDYANRGRVEARNRGRSGDVALSQQRAQVGGEPGVGHEYTVRDIERTKGAVRESVFDSTAPVSDAQTGKAWDLLESLTDLESGRAYTTAGDINRAGGNDISTALAKVELMNYAAKLAGAGDPRMINHLLATVNLMPNTEAGSGESTAGAVLRARKELESGLWKAVLGTAEAADAATAKMLGGKPPTAADVDLVRRLRADLAAAKLKPIEPGETVQGPGGKDLGAALGDKLRAEGVQFDNPMLQALVQIAKHGYDNGRKFTFTATNEPVATASQQTREAVGKLLKQGKGDKIRGQLEESGADGLEHAFWRQIDAPAEEGVLNQVDKAQNQQLANVVKDVLTRMGLEPPAGNKLTDAEKVATMLNKRPLDAEKRRIADERIKAEIEQRRERDLQAADTPEETTGVNAFYDNLRDAWDSANRRATDMPVSDSMMRRLLNTEFRSKANGDGVDFTAAVRSTDPRVAEAAKKAAVEKVIEKVEAASWPGADYSRFRTWLETTFDNMISVRKAKWDAAQAREAARRAGGIKPDDAANYLIQSFARSQSDTPAWPSNTVNAIRQIVRSDLSNRPDMGRREPWVSQLTSRLLNAGVSPETAGRLADRVWREHEIRDFNRQVRAQEQAAERGSLAPIVDAINETPLRERNGNWIERVTMDYLQNAGLSASEARQAAQSFAPAIQTRMAEAQTKAFEQSVKASELYKSHQTREPSKAKSDLDKILQAVRSGAADPSRSFTSDIAHLNGWKGYTPEQYRRMAELDQIYSDPQTLPYKRTQAAQELMEIAGKTNAPASFLKTLNEYYTANALSGIPTDAINVASPAVFLVRDAITEALTSAWKGPTHLESTVKSLLSALDGYVGELVFSAKNDTYSHHANEWFDHQSALKRKLDDKIAAFKSARGIAKSKHIPGILLGVHDIVRRTLSTLDQGSISVLEQWNLSRYAMAELRRRGMNEQGINTVLESVIEAKSRFFADARARGLGWAEAKAAANDFTRDAWIKALDAEGVKGADVALASINDALRSVGRVGKDSEGNRLRDVGMISSPMMMLIDGMAAISKNHPGIGLVYKTLFGFFATAARTVHGAAWYSPYGFIRLAADRAARKAGADSPYSQTLATDQQFRARLRDAFAGTIAAAILTPLMTSTADDDDDKKPVKISVTGAGPSSADPAVRDAWLKKHKPYSIELTALGQRAQVNLGRAGEALMPTFMLAGALDDLALRRKHESGKREPQDIDTATAVGSSLFYQFANRGPYAMLSKGGRMFPDRDNGGLVERFAGEAAYSAKPFIPLLGSTLAKNISDIFAGPLDKSTVPAAITANIPFVGPAVNEPALNRLGHPIGDQGFDAKLWRLGIPAVVSLPDDSEDRLAYELIREKGQGPPSLDRQTIERRYGAALSDRDWRNFIEIQGAYLTERMVSRYEELREMDGAAFNAKLEKWAGQAETRAAKELGLSRPKKSGE